MADLNLKSFDQLYPIMIRKYQTLIVDQNASVLDKINSIITGLNATGKLTNDVVKNWNAVMEWAMNDGLTADVNAKIESMFSNGEFDSVILAQLSGKANQTALDATNANVTSLTATVGTKANQSDLNQTNQAVTTNTNAIAQNSTKIQSNASIIASIGNGSPKGVYTNLSDLQTAFPSGTNGIYVISSTGQWYYWNGTAWASGGVYQATSIGDGTITRAKLEATLNTEIETIFNDDSVLYAIADNQNRYVFSITPDGVTHIYSLALAVNSVDESAIKGVQVLSDSITGVSWGIIDSQGYLSDLAIGLDGKILDSTIQSWKNRMNTVSLKPISCWGDSLTGGADGVPSNQLWAGLLSGLTGRTVYNMGVGGETSATISMRQGGSVAYVNNITIPSDTATSVLIADQQNNPLVDNWGHTVTPIKQQQAGVNPVTIAGVQGTLSITNPSLSTSQWFFNRSVAGSSVVINRPTPIITDAQNTHRDDIMIIFIGQNGGYNDNNELIQQIQAMIDFNSSPNPEYLVLGFTTLGQTDRQDLDNLMSHTFGRRFVNLRTYLSTYGMSDMGLTPTQTDLDYMSAGKVPPSLLGMNNGVQDYVHYNAYGHQVIANIVSQRLKELKIV